MPALHRASLLFLALSLSGLGACGDTPRRQNQVDGALRPVDPPPQPPDDGGTGTSTSTGGGTDPGGGGTDPGGGGTDPGGGGTDPGETEAQKEKRCASDPTWDKPIGEATDTSPADKTVVRVSGTLTQDTPVCKDPEGGCPGSGDCTKTCTAELKIGEWKVVASDCAPKVGCAGQKVGDDWELISCSPATGAASLRGLLRRDADGVRLELYGLD